MISAQGEPELKSCSRGLPYSIMVICLETHTPPHTQSPSQHSHTAQKRFRINGRASISAGKMTLK